VCRSKHVEPSINCGIINSVTKLHLVVISTVEKLTVFYKTCLKNFWSHPVLLQESNVISELVFLLLLYLAQPISVNKTITNTLLQSPTLLLPNVGIEKLDQFCNSE
jgi:hypothetical protein